MYVHNYCTGAILQHAVLKKILHRRLIYSELERVHVCLCAIVSQASHLKINGLARETTTNLWSRPSIFWRMGNEIFETARSGELYNHIYNAA